MVWTVRRILLPLVFVMLYWGVADAQVWRPFLMSSSAIQVVPNAEGFFINGPLESSFHELAAEADVITVMPEYLGIPFDEFYQSAEPSPTHPWTVAMKELALRARAPGKPILLQLVLTRDTVAGAALDYAGKLLVIKSWSPRCMAFDTPMGAAISIAYRNYSVWMANLFKPSHLVVFVEMNLYHVHCGGDSPSWRVLVQTERDAYDRIKAIHPTMAVYPSFKLEDLYAQQPGGFDEEHYAAIAVTKRDRFGVASYPYGLRKPDGSFVNPFEIPVDYFQRVHQRHPDEALMVVTETGWIADGPRFGSTSACYGPMPFSALVFPQIYLELLLYNGYLGNFELISWWSHRDLVPSESVSSCYPETSAPSFSECNGDEWCRAVRTARTQGLSGNENFDEFVFKAFGTMGLRNYDGTPKEWLTDRWNFFLSLPIMRPER